MDRQQIGLKLTLDALSLPARLDTFADRLVVQKAIYLAQVAGVQLGYHFHWYLRGPSRTRRALNSSSMPSTGTFTSIPSNAGLSIPPPSSGCAT
jgi:uncharacterized protein YwgA